MLKLNFLLIILLFSSPWGSENTKTIIFFGNSLTAGYGLASEQAFPALIQNYLEEKGIAVKVVNAGVSGETTAGGLSRINWVLNQHVDIFVLELGANDGLRGLPLNQTVSNLQQIIDQVKKANPKVEIIIAGMMVPPNMGQQYSNEFRRIFPDLAEKNKLGLIPFLLEGVAGDPELNLPDGIHPNVEGHKIVAGNILKILEEKI